MEGSKGSAECRRCAKSGEHRSEQEWTKGKGDSPFCGPDPKSDFSLGFNSLSSHDDSADTPSRRLPPRSPCTRQSSPPPQRGDAEFFLVEMQSGARTATTLGINVARPSPKVSASPRRSRDPANPFPLRNQTPVRYGGVYSVSPLRHLQHPTYHLAHRPRRFRSPSSPEME